VIDIGAIKKLAAGDKDHLKENLSIVYVLERAGHQPASTANGRISYLSPFRPDSKPSFDVWRSLDAERAGDFAQDWTGDVLDVLKLFAPDKSFGDILKWARRLLREQEESGWVAPELPEPVKFDVQAAADILERALFGRLAELQSFLLKRKDSLHLMDPNWLQREFRVGTVGKRLIVPYFNERDELVCYKHRKEGKFISAPGVGAYTCLYGAWRYETRRAQKPVLLCEGETDTWAAAYQVEDVFDVYGLPTGTGTVISDELLAPLRGRRVTIAFDADDAGQKATAKWEFALRDRMCSVALALLPQGMDVASTPDLHEYLVVPS
jgi:hypothetical protein